LPHGDEAMAAVGPIAAKLSRGRNFIAEMRRKEIAA
jgi:hypothetical protein